MVDVPSRSEFNLQEGRIINLENRAVQLELKVAALEAQTAALKNLGVGHETRITALEDGVEPTPEPIPPEPPPPTDDPGHDLLDWRDFTGWKTLRESASTNWLLFHPHVAGGVPAREENGRMVYEIIGDPSNYRSEHTIREHLIPDSNTYTYRLTPGVQYALAYPVEIHTWRKAPLEPGPGTVGDLGRSGIIFQFHEQAGGTQPPMTIRNQDGDIVVRYSNGTPGDTLVPNAEMGRRYNIVVGYRLEAGDDVIDVWVDGVQKHSRRGGLFINTPHYIKHGLYWTQRETYQRYIDARIEVVTSGYGQFAGPDAVQAALARVSQ